MASSNGKDITNLRTSILAQEMRIDPQSSSLFFVLVLILAFFFDHSIARSTHLERSSVGRSHFSVNDLTRFGGGKHFLKRRRKSGMQGPRPTVTRPTTGDRPRKIPANTQLHCSFLPWLCMRVDGWICANSSSFRGSLFPNE